MIKAKPAVCRFSAYLWILGVFLFKLLYTSGEAVLKKNLSDDEMIKILESKGLVETRDDLAKKVGDFLEPTDFRHHNYESMSDYLKRLAKAYPHLSALSSIGQSNENRELWVLTISVDAHFHVPGKPEFKYVANMHGNEVFGREALLYLAEILLQNYGKNRYITRLLNTTRIHLLPSMNPDGYERASEGDAFGITGRGNAHGVDLNRNFPIKKHHREPDTAIETWLVMEWTQKIPFVLSANIHAGTTLVNYPYDDLSNGQAQTGDHEVFVTLAYSYARAHARMYEKGPRCESEELNVGDPTNGITNGAEWYVVSGGMQDWNYLMADCFDVTIESNCIKFPYARELPLLWNENKYSLLHYIDLIHRSIHGFIVDKVTGKGIWNATISVTQTGKIVKSYKYGDYWRLIVPGKYEVKYDHPNYYPQTLSIVVTKNQPSVCQNVSLNPQPNRKNVDQPIYEFRRTPDNITNVKNDAHFNHVSITVLFVCFYNMALWKKDSPIL